MQRGLVGSEMCIRDRYQRRVHGKFILLYTDVSEGKTLVELRTVFEPKLVLIRHDPNIVTDSILASLSIKYDFLYLNIFDAIKEEIEMGTKMGKLLLQTKKPRELLPEISSAEDVKYSPVHFDRKLIIDLVKSKIALKRTNQMFIVIDGFVNSHKLKNLEDREELRPMDELFAVDKEIGEIKTMLNLTREEYDKVEDDRVPEKPEKIEKPVEKEEDKENKDETEQPPEKTEEGDPSDKPPFHPEDFYWTNTEGNPRTLGQLFCNWKKCAVKNMQSNEAELEGANLEIVMESLLSSVITGELSKTTVFIQVKFFA
eukprot:TRINITY_DN374_c0_g1_i5.p1 TRINITY_DN374_c0_g1~~TRINITY_DN374_c0_g1_i5.p1  ORF type:complete len:314 (-),score=80.26 TRINITY_DN374_c0_g1_i5:42-983(-)